MPKPTARDKTRSQYVSRFMGDAAMRARYPRAAQRVAVAYSHWKRYTKGK
jgi:hypothetical protein